MRELFFVLIVILVLLALTAIRYRKQIAGMIGLARMLKEAKNAAVQKNTIRGEQPGVQLVSCAQCGVWVPQNKAVKQREGVYHCSRDCQLVP